MDELACPGHVREQLLKHALKLKAEQDLRAKNEEARSSSAVLSFLSSSMRRMPQRRTFFPIPEFPVTREVIPT